MSRVQVTYCTCDMVVLPVTLLWYALFCLCLATFCTLRSSSMKLGPAHTCKCTLSMALLETTALDSASGSVLSSEAPERIRKACSVVKTTASMASLSRIQSLGFEKGHSLTLPELLVGQMHPGPALSIENQNYAGLKLIEGAKQFSYGGAPLHGL